MTPNTTNPIGLVCLLITQGMLVGGSPVLAQITPDNSLGAETSRVTPNGTLRDGRQVNQRIDGGAIRGSNLFHSFLEFNVGNNEQVYFSNPDGIETILSRVTGNDVSDILGVLGVDGNANLFLLNPNGFVFGPNAWLDIRGSFLATTADSYIFPGGFEFSTNNPQTPPLLTVNVPLGVQYGVSGTPVGLRYGANPGAIEVNGATLLVDSGQSLVLAGGDITLSEARLATIDLLTFGYPRNGGRIEFGASGTGIIGLNHIGNSFGLEFSNLTPRANIGINDSLVRVAAVNGGDIVINSQSLDLDNSDLIAGIALDTNELSKRAGNIILSASEVIIIKESDIRTSAPFSQRLVFFDISDAGDINITATLLLVDESKINVGTSVSGDGQANSGDLVFNARDDIILNNSFLSASTVRGDAGRITLNAKNRVILLTTKTLSNNYTSVSSMVFEQGRANNITINAGGNLHIESSVPYICPDGCAVLSSGFSGQGRAGSIRLNVGGDIAIVDTSTYGNTRLSTSTSGQGEAGSVTLNADGNIYLDGSRIFSSVQRVGNGNAGEINISAQSLTLTNGAQLQTLIDRASDGSTAGRGNAGNINIRTDDFVEATEFSVITSEVRQDANGNGGQINVSTDSFSLSNGSTLSTDTSGQGNAGSISINADRAINVDHSNIFSDINLTGNGKGGQINLSSEFLSLSNGARVSTNLYGQGNAGAIEIDASDRAELLNGSRLSSSTFSRGNAGNITIRGNTFVGDDTAIFSNIEAGGNGRGGRITIDAATVQLLNGAQLQSSVNQASENAPAGQGMGGDVVLIVDGELNIAGENIAENVSGIFSNLEPGATGQAGNIRISAGSFLLSNRGLITANTEGRGNAGTIKINTGERVTLFRSATISSNTLGQYDAGLIEIDAGDRVSLSSGAQVSSSGFGQGNPGSIVINAENGVLIRGIGSSGFSSGIFTRSQGGAIRGRGGSITIATSNFRIADGAVIDARTFDARRGGNITISADTFAALNGGQIITTTTNEGRAGNIELNIEDSIALTGIDPTYPQRLREFGRGSIANEVNNGAVRSGLLATTAADSIGDGGNITINSEIMTIQDGARIAVDSRGGGRGGNITLQEIDTLQVAGGQISALAQASQAGNININALDSVQLDEGGEISVEASNGTAGGLGIQTGQLTVAEGSDISVSSPQGTAGNLTIDANAIQLDRGFLRADIGGLNASGAEINLQLEGSLGLRNDSRISATAAENATGGNVTIHAPNGFVIAPPGDNDIIANAFRGRGGNIEITSQGILGFVEGPATSDSNDIDASSEFGSPGTITLNSPIDLTQGIIQLPENVVDASDQIARSCPGRSATEEADRSHFVATGRGGLPPNPNHTLENNSAQVEWYAPDRLIQNEQTSNPANQAAIATEPSSTEVPIVEAQGWAIAPDGQIALVANSATASLPNPAFTPRCSP